MSLTKTMFADELIKQADESYEEEAEERDLLAYERALDELEEPEEWDMIDPSQGGLCGKTEEPMEEER